MQYSDRHVELTEAEELLIIKGKDYRELRQSPGWKRLIAHLVSYCNNQLEQLRTDNSSGSEKRLASLDRWQAYEAMYSEIITEVEGTVAALEEKERELREQGIIYPELGIGPLKSEGE